jgi:hypothetical protein
MSLQKDDDEHFGTNQTNEYNIRLIQTSVSKNCSNVISSFFSVLSFFDLRIKPGGSACTYLQLLPVVTKV